MSQDHNEEESPKIDAPVIENKLRLQVYGEDETAENSDLPSESSETISKH